MSVDVILMYELHLKSGDWAQYLRAPKLVERALSGADIVPAVPEGSLKEAILSTPSLARKWKRGDMSAAAQLAGIYSRDDAICLIRRMYESTSVPRQKNVKSKRIDVTLPQPAAIDRRAVWRLLNAAESKKDSFMPYCAPHCLSGDTVRRLAAAVGVDAIMLAKRGRNFNSLYELSGEWPAVVFGPTASLTSIYHELVHHVAYAETGTLGRTNSAMRRAEVVAECAGAVAADMLHGLPDRETQAAAEYAKRHMDGPGAGYVEEICQRAGVVVAAARPVLSKTDGWPGWKMRRVFGAWSQQQRDAPGAAAPAPGLQGAQYPALDRTQARSSRKLS